MRVRVSSGNTITERPPWSRASAASKVAAPRCRSPRSTGMNPAARYIQSRPDATLFEIIEECERRVIIDMLEKCAWNQTDAANQFHIPLSTLNQKIKRLNIEIPRKLKTN